MAKLSLGISLLLALHVPVVHCSLPPPDCETSPECVAFLPPDQAAFGCEIGATLICDPEECGRSIPDPNELFCLPTGIRLGDGAPEVDASGCATCWFSLRACIEITEATEEDCIICPEGTPSLCGGGAGNDPHIWGFSGQSFYWSGGDRTKFHALVHDSDVSINGRAAPRYEDDALLPYSDLVSLAVSTRPEGLPAHRVGVFGATDARLSSPDAFSDLPAHAVGVLVDGEPLGNGVHVFDEGLTVAVVNVPHVCKVDSDEADSVHGLFDVDGGEVRPKKQAPAVQSLRRRLVSTVDSWPWAGNARSSWGKTVSEPQVRSGGFKETLEQWLASGNIKGAPSESNDWTNECLEWLEGKDVFESRLDGLLTTVVIKTPAMTMRIEHWGFDVDAASGSEPLMLNMHLNGWRPSAGAHGVLGQTIRPQAPGQPPLEGRDEDYALDDAFATSFKFFPARHNDD